MSDNEKKVFSQEVNRDDLRAAAGGLVDDKGGNSREARKDADRTHCIKF